MSRSSDCFFRISAFDLTFGADELLVLDRVVDRKRWLGLGGIDRDQLAGRFQSLLCFCADQHDGLANIQQFRIGQKRLIAEQWPENVVRSNVFRR